MCLELMFIKNNFDYALCSETELIVIATEVATMWRNRDVVACLLPAWHRTRQAGTHRHVVVHPGTITNTLLSCKIDLK